MVIGYIRVSTEQQSMKNQKHKLLEYAQNNKMIIDEFIELEISSKKDQKEKLLDKVFEKLKSSTLQALNSSLQINLNSQQIRMKLYLLYF